MAAVQYAEWVARGRAHQREGRAIDAILCFRQAARAAPRAVEPRLHLGETLWQLGRVKDAIGAWRGAAEVAPDNLNVLLPLAESLLATGDAAAARDVAARAVALAPLRGHAIALYGLARLTLGEASPDDAPIDTTARVFTREAWLLSVPTLAGPLALALDAAPASPARSALLAHLAREPDKLAPAPPLLLALAIEHELTLARDDTPAVRAALFAQGGARGYTADDHDVLRRIALAACTVLDPTAGSLRAYYAQVCGVGRAPPFPLAWPRRCAGPRLRVVALIGGHVDPAVAQWLAVIAGENGSGCDVALAVLDPGSADALPEVLRSLPTLPLPRVPDADVAKRVAALDADVLVDLVGLAAPAGVLLAQRAARRVLSVATPAAHNVPPLVDATLPSLDALADAIDAMRGALAGESTAALDSRAMGEAWEAAVRAHQQGEHSSAREQYGRFLDVQPRFAPAHYLRGILHRQQGDLSAAGEDFAAALAIAPGYADARLAATRLALDVGDADRAAALCAAGLEAMPRQLELLRTYGLAELARHDGAAAASLFERALAIDPSDGDTHYNHGVALQMKPDLAAAARAYQRALALQPELPAADFNLGVIFQAQGNVDAAVAAYGNVLARDPKRIAAYKNLGEALLAAGRLDAWYANFRKFEANCPDALALATQALEVLQHRGDYAGIERYLDGLRVERYQATNEIELCDDLEQLLYLLLFFDIEPSVIFRFAQTYDVTAQRVYGTALPPPPSRRPGRLRIGYLSADLRNHVMGKMAWQALQHHDRSRFALYFYSLSAQKDDWTAKFKGIADGFDVLAHLGEREAAERIARDDLDLLVDLSTHTNGAKPGILAWKPARVLLTHIASAGSVGLSAIDFKLTDGYADVPENQTFQSETLLPMAGCAYPFRRIAPATTHPFHRARLGIAADTVLIGAFVTPLKLSRRCLGLWREVLARIPRAKLVFSPANPAFRASYSRLAAAAQIGPDQILFLPQGRDDAENQARYALIDFVLDPMPFGGVNGTIEALDMGVPVVTLVGKRHGERTTYSILANLGVTQTIAQSGREYVDIAARLADDPPFAREIRAAIQTGLAGSALTDADAHTRNLEATYLEAIRMRAPDALRDAQCAPR